MDLVKFVRFSGYTWRFMYLQKGTEFLETRVHMTNLTRFLGLENLQKSVCSYATMSVYLYVCLSKKEHFRSFHSPFLCRTFRFFLSWWEGRSSDFTKSSNIITNRGIVFILENTFANNTHCSSLFILDLTVQLALPAVHLGPYCCNIWNMNLYVFPCCMWWTPNELKSSSTLLLHNT